MAEPSLEEILGEVRQLTGSLASARLISGNEQTGAPEAEQARLRAARLIEEVLRSHLQQSFERIEAEHQKRLKELSRDQAAMLGRLCEKLEQALQHRRTGDRATEERMIGVCLASVERRLSPQIEELRLLLKQQQAELSHLTERPLALSPRAVFWLGAMAVTFIGGALFAPELAQVLRAVLELLR